ncbi:hypothetical protein HF313_05645 [Massilia atriviolacea]|uniref:hypothetical protein n=1 Tax=Massilia atriviolacea TaxID=2495579 RepID=UPI0013DF2E49|nr:hypothetical protein [Massilia atriviolacea]
MHIRYLTRPRRHEDTIKQDGIAHPLVLLLAASARLENPGAILAFKYSGAR